MSSKRPSLSSAFFEELDAATREAFSSPDSLEEKLREWVKEGAERWPTLKLSPELFVRHLAQRLPSGLAASRALDSVRAEELFLACACVHGKPGSAELFDTHFLTPVLAQLRLGQSMETSRDDLGQLLREQLFVAGGRKLSTYSGRAPVASWLKLVAKRLAIDLRRKGHRREEPLPSAWDRASSLDQTAEHRLSQARSARAVRSALSTALLSLSRKERRLLRLYYLEGQSLNAISTRVGAPRSTLWFWISEARRRALQVTRDTLAGKLHLRDAELDSLLANVQSELEASLSKLGD